MADPGWNNPLDGRYAAVAGGRWNPPGSFRAVYLNLTAGTARANVLRRLEGQPYGPEDLDGASAPVLVVTVVPAGAYTDCVTDEGCLAAGLPVSYPMDGAEVVGWRRCQPVGVAAWEAGSPGIASRSAAGYPFVEEELAWFQRGRSLSVERRLNFSEWFWPPG